MRALEDLRRDLILAVRGLARRPTFTATVVLTLALGIGANTAVFSIVNPLLLRPLPFPAADDLGSRFGLAPANERLNLSHMFVVDLAG